MKTEADIRNLTFLRMLNVRLQMFTHAKCALQNVLYTKKLFTHGERALKMGFRMLSTKISLDTTKTFYAC